MHCRFALVFAAAAAVCAQSECSESNCDGEDVSSLMSVQLLQTDRHISKTKSVDGEHHFAGIKRDFSDLLGEHHETAHGGEHREVVHSKGHHTKQDPYPTAEELLAGDVDHGAATGVGANADDDIYAFIAALIANVVTIVGCVAVFMGLRGAFPMIYSNNVETTEDSPHHQKSSTGGLFPAGTIPEGALGWFHAAWGTSTDFCVEGNSAEKIGLDNALLLQFTEVCMRILLFIGIPLVFIEGPLNMFFGGNAAGLDYMSYLSFGNVEVGHPWLYYVHACFVWYVVLTVQINIYAAQRNFLKQRTKWLKGLPDKRANTLLVEGIPEQHRSDTALKQFFEKMLQPGSVTKACILKDTTELCKACAERDALQQQIAEAGEDASKIQQLETEKKAVEERIVTERRKVADNTRDPMIPKNSPLTEMGLGEEGAPNPWTLSKGFVEFKQARQAQIALNLQFNSDSSVWVTSVPPEPRDMLWNDLTADPTVQAMRDVIGYALVVGLYFAYMPLVIGISQVAAAIDAGPLTSLWEGLAPTLGLQIMVAFLPTILLLIFRSFFILKADAWSQTKLQKWYFWFQIVFVILITAIGDSVVEFTTTIFTDPIAVFGMLAETMPHATHFYMNFLVLQWTTHAMNLLRYVPLSKFKAFERLYEPEEARAKAEPEDQDYYGLGSRSARFTINMVIGVVYSTLSPTVALLAWMNFFCCRVFYGYLIPFAETKKPDLGGVFWVTKLEHVFIGNVIYCILMTGVLFGRAPTSIPGIAVAPTIFYVLWSLGRFKEAFSWENLPFEAVAEEVACKKREMQGEYVQPEMLK
jgi:hypothetical protein